MIDEADLILSYGHDEAVKAIFSGGFMPKVVQAFLMSATMTKDVETLKGLVMRNPVSASRTSCPDDELIPKHFRPSFDWKKMRMRPHS